MFFFRTYSSDLQFSGLEFNLQAKYHMFICANQWLFGKASLKISDMCLTEYFKNKNCSIAKNISHGDTWLNGEKFQLKLMKSVSFTPKR